MFDYRKLFALPYIGSAVDDSRIEGIDFLRGLSCLFVLTVHWFQYPDAPTFPNSSFVGVDIFFVISGYLIGGILIKNYLKTGSVDQGRFFITRGVRIYPLHWVYFTYNIITIFCWNGHVSGEVTPIRVFGELFYLQNFFQGLQGITWSLAIEEQFYILLPILMQVVISITGSIGSLPKVLVVLSVLPIIFRGITYGVWGSSEYHALYCYTFNRLEGLCLGVALAHCSIYQTERMRLLREKYGAILGFVGSVFICSAYGLNSKNSGVKAASYVAGFSVYAIGATLVLFPLSAVTRFKGPLLLLRPVSMLGYYSYAVYLFHINVKKTVVYIKRKTGIRPLYDAPTYPVYLGLAIFVGYVLYSIVDGTTRQWYSNWLKTKSPEALEARKAKTRASLSEQSA